MKKYTESRRMQLLAGLITEAQFNNDVTIFVEDHLDDIKQKMGIDVDVNGDENMATIDYNDKTYLFSFDPKSLEDIQTGVKELDINGVTLYYVVVENNM